MRGASTLLLTPGWRGGTRDGCSSRLPRFGVATAHTSGLLRFRVARGRPRLGATLSSGLPWLGGGAGQGRQLPPTPRCSHWLEAARICLIPPTAHGSCWPGAAQSHPPSWLSSQLTLTGRQISKLFRSYKVHRTIRRTSGFRGKN